jgi:hypothetical protein
MDLSELHSIPIYELSKDGQIAGYLKIWTDEWKEGGFIRRKFAEPIERVQWLVRWQHSGSDRATDHYDDAVEFDSDAFMDFLSRKLFQFHGEQYECRKLDDKEADEVRISVFKDGSDETWGPSLPS